MADDAGRDRGERELHRMASISSREFPRDESYESADERDTRGKGGDVPRARRRARGKFLFSFLLLIILLCACLACVCVLTSSISLSLSLSIYIYINYTCDCCRLYLTLRSE